MQELVDDLRGDRVDDVAVAFRKPAESGLDAGEFGGADLLGTSAQGCDRRDDGQRGLPRAEPLGLLGHDPLRLDRLAPAPRKGRRDDRLEVVAPKAEAPAEKPAVFYTVKSGDTLSKIAKEQYGDAQKYPAIFEANKPMLSDPNKIYPGQLLRIPPL